MTSPHPLLPAARRRPRTRLLVAALVALGLAVAACGSSDGASSGGTTDTTGGGSSSAFPVTIPHAFGETTVEAEPTRVVTWGWGSTDAAIALGVVPVAMPHQDYGGDAEGVLPWIRDALEDEGAELPQVLPDAEEPPFEAIAAARPDLILAVYSGITDADYETLSQIAPTVAYPDEAWATPWQETITIVGDALGRPEQAAAVLADIDAELADQAAAHPELAGKSVAVVWPSYGETYVYRPADARVDFTLDLGLVSAPSVDALASGDETFYYTISSERLDELTSDVLVAYADTEAQAAEFMAAPEAQLMAQVRDGTVAQVVGTEFIAAVSPPTALSLTWGLDDYVALLAEAAAASDAPS